MVDAATTAGWTADTLPTIAALISAGASLGTASMSLVDALKVFGGGPSRIGYGTVEQAVSPFIPAEAPARNRGGAFGRDDILRTLKANWMNGVPKADQKAKAKALIHLGLTPDNAQRLADAANVDGTILRRLTEHVANGQAPGQDEINALGQFDVVLSAVLDAAYERADQLYRNFCKALAVPISTGLSLGAGWAIFPQGLDGTSGFGAREIVALTLIGLSAVPIAPVSKDLVSAIQAAAAAVRPLALRRP